MDCRSGHRVDYWDRARCDPICWALRDGGWAAQVVEWFYLCHTREPMSGAVQIDWHAVRVALPADVLADDEERLDVMQALRLAAATVNALDTDEGAAALLLPDEDAGDG